MKHNRLGSFNTNKFELKTFTQTKKRSKMRKISFLFSFMMILSFGLQAQTMEELKTMRADKQAQLDALQAEVDGLSGQIDAYPGWKIGGAGVVGLNLLSNNDWFALATPNSSNNTLGIGFGAFARNDQEKYFWNNLLNVNVTRVAAFGDKDIDATKSVAIANGLDLSSLFGYKLSPKWALSAEGKWTSTILEFDAGDVNDNLDDKFNLAFNAPGQITVSAGLTWLPIDGLVVIIHPLGYQLNLPGDLTSTAGAKIGATYAATIIKGISWTSNLSAFIPYGGAGINNIPFKNAAGDDTTFGVDYSTGDLVTWDWLNGFSFSVWKGVGVAFQLGLRGNKSVADIGRLGANAISGTPDPAAVNLSDSPLQSYYTLGLGYTF